MYGSSCSQVDSCQFSVHSSCWLLHNKNWVQQEVIALLALQVGVAFACRLFFPVLLFLSMSWWRLKKYQLRECRDIDRWSWMRFAVPIKYLRYELWINKHQNMVPSPMKLVNRALLDQSFVSNLMQFMYVVRQLIHMCPNAAAVSANLTSARTALCSSSQWMIMLELHQELQW